MAAVHGGAHATLEPGPHPGFLAKGAVSGAWEELWVWFKLLGSKSGSLHVIG